MCTIADNQASCWNYSTYQHLNVVIQSQTMCLGNEISQDAPSFEVEAQHEVPGEALIPSTPA